MMISQPKLVFPLSDGSSLSVDDYVRRDFAFKRNQSPTKSVPHAVETAPGEFHLDPLMATESIDGRPWWVITEMLVPTEASCSLITLRYGGDLIASASPGVLPQFRHISAETLRVMPGVTIVVDYQYGASIPPTGSHIFSLCGYFLRDRFFVERLPKGADRSERRSELIDHVYVSAGDNPHASGDVAYVGCSLVVNGQICNQSRGRHRR